jgi:hypothetical protein
MHPSGVATFGRHHRATKATAQVGAVHVDGDRVVRDATRIRDDRARIAGHVSAGRDVAGSIRM